MDLYPNCPNHSADEMVYTKARLEHALRVFRETSSYLRKKGFPSENLERHLRSKYAFRKSSKVAPMTNVTLWQDKSNGSGDDEYNPDKDKKKLNPKKRKRPEQKRKTTDSGDKNRNVKESRGEEKGDCVYVSLMLTGEKGKQLLRKLSLVHKTDLASFEEAGLGEVEPSYWKRYSSSNGGGGSTRRDSKLDVLSDDGLTEMDLDDEPGLDLHVLPTSLRSGKIRPEPKDEKKIDSPTHGVSKHNELVTKDPISKVSHHNVIQKTPLPRRDTKSRSSDQIGLPWRTIELDKDGESDQEMQEPANSHQKTDSCRSINVNLTMKRNPESPPTPVSLIDNFSIQTQSLIDEPGLITIDTAYAHPIDFRYMPPVGQKCDFCADWRMGILGHGKRTIQIFIDPEHPTQFQEMGNGHRSAGKPCTKMCVSCALDRLLIVRCHSTDQDNDSSEAASLQRIQRSSPFSRIPGVIYNAHNLSLYQKSLLPRPGTPEASAPPSRTGPLPTCSLCPTVAMWQCCKWQRTDKMKKPCRVPDEAGSVTSGAMPTTGLPNGHKKTPSIIVISDSDDEFPSTTPTTASSQSSFHQARSTLSANSSQQALRAPLKGCGLKLCTPCKTFVEGQCNGLLIKKRIMKWLREESKIKIGRADLEWLFEGSNLARTYEWGSRR